VSQKADFNSLTWLLSSKRAFSVNLNSHYFVHPSRQPVGGAHVPGRRCSAPPLPYPQSGCLHSVSVARAERRGIRERRGAGRHDSNIVRQCRNSADRFPACRCASAGLLRMRPVFGSRRSGGHGVIGRKKDSAGPPVGCRQFAGILNGCFVPDVVSVVLFPVGALMIPCPGIPPRYPGPCGHKRRAHPARLFSWRHGRGPSLRNCVTVMRPVRRVPPFVPRWSTNSPWARKVYTSTTAKCARRAHGPRRPVSRVRAHGAHYTGDRPSGRLGDNRPPAHEPQRGSWVHVRCDIGNGESFPGPAQEPGRRPRRRRGPSALPWINTRPMR
jgi:hypothetical protein